MAKALNSTELTRRITSGEWAFIGYHMDPQVGEVAIYSDRTGPGIPTEVWVDTVPTMSQDWTYIER